MDDVAAFTYFAVESCCFGTIFVHNFDFDVSVNYKEPLSMILTP